MAWTRNQMAARAARELRGGFYVKWFLSIVYRLSLLQAVSDSSPLVSQRIHQPSRKSDTTQLKSTSTINRHHEGLEDKTVSFERDDKMTMRAAFRSLNIGGLPPQSYLTVKVSGVEWVNAPAVTVTVTL